MSTSTMTTNSKENRFIPAYICSSTITAVTAPYLSILIRDLGYSPVWVGILLGINSLAGIAGPIFFGYLADKAGNYRPFLIITSLLPAFIAFPLVWWVHPVFTAIFLALMAIGLRSIISLLDAITTIQIGRTGNYGRIRVWGSISFIMVTLILQWTPFLKPDTAGNISMWIFITAIVSVVPILTLPGFFLRAVTEHHNEPAEESAAEAVADTSEKTGRKFPVSLYAVGGFAAIFLCSFSMSSNYTYFPLYLTEALNWNAVGLLFAIATASEVPIMFLSGALIRRFGPLPLLALSAAGIVMRLLIWAFLPFKPCIIASQLLHALCFGTFHPAAVYFVVSIFVAKNRGVGMSVYTTLGAVSALIGNVAGGAIVEGAGYQFLFTLYAAIAGLAALICTAMRVKNSSKPID